MKWIPRTIELEGVKVSETDFDFAIEQTTKTLYSLFCRFERTRQVPKVPVQPKHKELTL